MGSVASSSPPPLPQVAVSAPQPSVAAAATPTIVPTLQSTPVPQPTLAPTALPTPSPTVVVDNPLRRPEGVALDREGGLWIADYGHDRIVKLGLDGRVTVAAGARGSGAGEFLGPKGIAVDPSSGRAVRRGHGQRARATAVARRHARGELVAPRSPDTTTGRRRTT